MVGNDLECLSVTRAHGARVLENNPKSEARNAENPKQIQMTEIQMTKRERPEAGTSSSIPSCENLLAAHDCGFAGSGGFFS